VRSESDVSFIRNAVGDMELVGTMSFSDTIMEADIKGLPSYKASETVVNEARKIKASLEKGV
jgi:CO dehydrogenase nickel-insertion accessory protein CooC1